MIAHNSLGERLNAIKNGKPIPEPPKQSEINFPDFQIPPFHKTISYKQFFVSEGYKLFNVMGASILYGFGIKALFSMDWNFLGILGVGFLLNHALTILLKLFKK